VKFHHALQIALSPLALFEHVVLTSNPLVEHLTAPVILNRLAAVRFVFELFAISRPSVQCLAIQGSAKRLSLPFSGTKG
jgi:hypothetical protein